MEQHFQYNWLSMSVCVHVCFQWMQLSRKCSSLLLYVREPQVIIKAEKKKNPPWKTNPAESKQGWFFCCNKIFPTQPQSSFAGEKNLSSIQKTPAVDVSPSRIREQWLIHRLFFLSPPLLTSHTFIEQKSGTTLSPLPSVNLNGARCSEATRRLPVALQSCKQTDNKQSDTGERS